MTRRGALLLPVAALAVHGLRYWLAYGGAAHRELLDQGHAYLHSLTPWLVLATRAALGAGLGRTASRWRAGGAARARAAGGRLVGADAGVLLRLWLSAAAALLAIYAGQELLEGMLSSGHAGGLAGVFGGGGFWAVPAALSVGGLVALALRGADAVLHRLAARRAVTVVRRRPAPTARPRDVLLPPRAPLASRAAGRAPPARAPHPTLV